MGDLDCVSCVSDGLCVRGPTDGAGGVVGPTALCWRENLCVCSFVSVVVCVSPSKICVCDQAHHNATESREWARSLR